MRSLVPAALAFVAASSLLARSDTATAQAGAGVVFLTTRPPRDFRGNIRAWANQHRANSYNEDTTAHVWRVQFMAFCSRPPRAAEVTVSFFKIEGRNRRYITNESIALSNPNDAVFFHNTVLHRSPDEFMPMENYEVAISVATARGNTEIARGRIGLVGQVERRSGVVDFTGANGPTVR